MTFQDGSVYRASLIGSDPSAGVAVLYVKEVSRKNSSPCRLQLEGESRRVCGLLSLFLAFSWLYEHLHRQWSGEGSIPAQEGEGFTIPDIIQTDAPINPWNNSGGPSTQYEG